MSTRVGIVAEGPIDLALLPSILLACCIGQALLWAAGGRLGTLGSLAVLDVQVPTGDLN